MIIGEQKPIAEIWEMIKGYRRIIVFGCNSCVAVCHAGGIKQAEILASLLRMMAAQEGIEKNVEFLACERQCEPEFIMSQAETLKKQDLVLSIACGVGVNLVSALILDTPIFPGLNTEFYGAVPRAGVFEEVCAGCGNCILHLTGGICPIARCAKSILNGPCGGTNKGKCEISPDVDCAWYLIVERMKHLGTFERLFEIQPPKNWATSTHGGPRRVVIEYIAKLEETEEKKGQGGRSR
ncbi:MAG TPA: methylenetetrahydrofolate reductase C-terminal domain-containing protein [Nitrospirota bacterium]|nr:methylenetetrahydrofolate reductase C-terminal domain-containing protein [Nitrospirota bacterium]